jgi:hypothetical protein
MEVQLTGVRALGHRDRSVVGGEPKVGERDYCEPDQGQCDDPCRPERARRCLLGDMAAPLVGRVRVVLNDACLHTLDARRYDSPA